MSQPDKKLHSFLFTHFLGGVVWGVGSVIGASLIISLMLGFLKYVDFIPVVGGFATQVVNEVETNRLRK